MLEYLHPARHQDPFPGFRRQVHFCVMRWRWGGCSAEIVEEVGGVSEVAIVDAIEAKIDARDETRILLEEVSVRAEQAELEHVV